MTEETNILNVPVNDADNKTTFSVTFSDIKVRVYNGTIGDNPACSQGVPISLDWTYSDEQVIQIDEFERNRGPRQKKENLIISPWTRYNLLLNKWDVPMHAIKEATAQIKIIKHSRRKSSQDQLKKSHIFRYLTSLVDKIRSYRKRQKRRKRRTLKRCVASKKNLERLYGDLISTGKVENLPAQVGNSSDRASETDKIQHVANNKNLPGRYGRPFSEHDMQSIIGNALAPTVEITTCSSALSI